MRQILRKSMSVCVKILGISILLASVLPAQTPAVTLDYKACPATFDHPFGLAFDGTNLWISSAGNDAASLIEMNTSCGITGGKTRNPLFHALTDTDIGLSALAWTGSQLVQASGTEVILFDRFTASNLTRRTLQAVPPSDGASILIDGLDFKNNEFWFSPDVGNVYRRTANGNPIGVPEPFLQANPKVRFDGYSGVERVNVGSNSFIIVVRQEIIATSETAHEPGQLCVHHLDASLVGCTTIPGKRYEDLAFDGRYLYAADNAAEKDSGTGNKIDKFDVLVNGGSIFAPPKVTSACLTSPIAPNVPFTQRLAATGGSGDYIWSIIPNLTGLPPDLKIDAITGVISGIPTTPGVYTFREQVQDSVGNNDIKDCSITVGLPVKITTTCAAFKPGEVNAPYSTQITATGGIATINFSAPTSPANLTIGSTTGLITGIPAVARNGQNIIIKATDTFTSDTLSCAIDIIPPPTITTACPLPTATVGVSYAPQTIQVTGGTGPYTFPANASLAALGLTVSSAGVIGGVPLPSAVGSQTFTVIANDALNVPASKSCGININPALVITGISSTVGVAGVGSALNVIVTGGSGKYTYGPLAPPIPGLSLDPATGVLSGPPSLAGKYTPTITVTDNLGIATSKMVSFAVSPGITTACPLPAATVRSPYSAPLSAFGLNGAGVWTVLRGLLPPGLAIANGPTSFITGTPTGPGFFPVTLQVADANGNTASFDCSISSDYPPLTNTTTCPLPDGTVGVAYFQSLTGSGGGGPISFSVNGLLPPGLQAPGNNSIRGIPTTAGVFNFSLQLGSLPPQSCGITIKPNPITITGGCPLPGGKQNVAYNTGVSASGGKPPYTFGAAGLPAGLGIDPATGLISGKPSGSSSPGVTLSVTDSAGTSATQPSCALPVAPADKIPLSITTACPFTTAMVGQTYSQSISATGGVSPYSFTASGLPGGLTINPVSGVISGQPAQDGSFPVSVQVSDATGTTASGPSCTIVVNKVVTPPAIAPCALPNGRVGIPYNQPLAVLPGTGTAPFLWASLGGTPPGVSVTSDGLVKGTPGVEGTFNFSVMVTDNNKATAPSANCSVTITPPLAISSIGPASPIAGGNQDITITVAGSGFTTDSTVLWNGTPLATTFVSSTQLTAVVPAALLYSPGTAVIAVRTGEGTVSPNSSLTIVLPTVPAISLTVGGANPPASFDPASQPTLAVKLASAYPFDITGTVTLNVTPDPSVVGKVDPLVRFMNATPPSTTTFTIKAGEVSANLVNPLESTGTVAGMLTFQFSNLQSQGMPLTPAPASVIATVKPSAPVITSPVVCTLTGGQVQVQVVGYTTTRSLSRADIVFTPATGATLDKSTFQQQLGAVSDAYFGSDTSVARGGNFMLTLPFTLTGDASSVDSVSLTLTNSAGTSAGTQARRCQ